MVYMSVFDYASSKWAEVAGVDVVVVGDSLAMVAHGYSSTVPATMDMMILHSQAVRRGAPNTFSLGCMPYQSYRTAERALTNATRFMQEGGCDAVKPQGGKSQAHMLRALVDAGHPDRIAYRADPAHDRDVRRLQDPGAHRGSRHEDPRGRAGDRGRRLLHARIRSGAREDRQAHLRAADDPDHRHRCRLGADGQILLCYDLLGAFTDFKPKFTKRFAQTH